MKRRDSLRTILLGTLGGMSLSTTASSCQGSDSTEIPPNEPSLYGRTPEELERDQEIMSEEYLNEREVVSIAVLCDIILPASDTAGSATDAEVPSFIAFIVKDIPDLQLPVRGGLMWLDGESNRRFNKEFAAATPEEQIQIIDDIAYPDPDNEKPELGPGINFFNLMRNLTLTGYYTTQMGVEDLGYTGNYANTWDGIPEEVLAEHDVDYDEEWLAKCVDQSKRMEIAEWDDEGNLLT